MLLELRRDFFCNSKECNAKFYLVRKKERKKRSQIFLRIIHQLLWKLWPNQSSFVQGSYFTTVAEVQTSQCVDERLLDRQKGFL